MKQISSILFLFITYVISVVIDSTESKQKSNFEKT
jgi:hypothetical protein